MIFKNYMKRSIFAVIMILIPAALMAEANHLIEDLQGYFNGFTGCFILFDEAENMYTVYNEEKSRTEISPCSTFKIYHSLFGLDSGVMEDENTIFDWDGTEYQIPSWNKDQSLKDAVQNSVVWYFQEAAGRIGIEKERSYINKINYGNMDLSGGLTTFWLQSSLKITPQQQLELLIKFYNYELPFSGDDIDIVKEILFLRDESGAKIFGKTGTGVANGKTVNGWFVGFVEKGDRVYYFVTNMEGDSGASGSRAKQVTFNILRDKHIFISP